MKGEEELEDEDEDENLSLSSRSRDPEKKPLALDDSVLQKLKQNESEKTPIPTRYYFLLLFFPLFTSLFIFLSFLLFPFWFSLTLTIVIFKIHSFALELMDVMENL